MKVEKTLRTLKLLSLLEAQSRRAQKLGKGVAPRGGARKRTKELGATQLGLPHMWRRLFLRAPQNPLLRGQWRCPGGSNGPWRSRPPRSAPPVPAAGEQHAACSARPGLAAASHPAAHRSLAAAWRHLVM